MPMLIPCQEICRDDKTQSSSSMMHAYTLCLESIAISFTESYSMITLKENNRSLKLVFLPPQMLKCLSKTTMNTWNWSKRTTKFHELSEGKLAVKSSEVSPLMIWCVLWQGVLETVSFWIGMVCKIGDTSAFYWMYQCLNTFFFHLVLRTEFKAFT